MKPHRSPAAARILGYWSSRQISCVLLNFTFLFAPRAGTAQQYGDFEYSVNGNAVTITAYVGGGGAVTIPSRIGGLPVTGIGASLFFGRLDLTSITIPSSVTTIGAEAFSGCTGLASITIPNSVTTIGVGAFGGCSGLASVTIPNSVTCVGECAFALCCSLVSASVGNGVTSIEEEAFAQCYSLASVSIGNNVTNIGDQAFAQCCGLKAITVDPRNTAYSGLDGVMFDKSLSFLIQCPASLAGPYTVPASVISIGDQAFYCCSALTSVTIGACLTTIGESAFSGCANLTCVHFEGNSPAAGPAVFSGDDYATIYYLPGTAGWGPFFAGRPAVLWNLRVAAGGAGLGVRTKQFGFTVTSTNNLTVVVDACTNLANPSWVPLQTNTLTSGSLYFGDPGWTNYPRRFYRVRWP